MGALLGHEVVYAEKGDLVFKPRAQWHTFWNSGDGPCRILEIISPGGFERLFEEAADDPEAMAGETVSSPDARYGLEVDYYSIERLCEEHGLTFPAGSRGGPQGRVRTADATKATRPDSLRRGRRTEAGPPGQPLLYAARPPGAWDRPEGPAQESNLEGARARRERERGGP